VGKGLSKFAVLAFAMVAGVGCQSAEFAPDEAVGSGLKLNIGLLDGNPEEAMAMAGNTPFTAAPAGFISFCIRFPDQCAAPADQPETVTLTKQVWTTLEDVNAQINRAVKFEDDKEHYGRAEFWTIPTDGYGDCEDYALAKRKALIDAGLPEKALRVAVVRTWKGEGHAVLTVSTDHGDYVLDNREWEILPWTRSKYIWLSRQDAENPMAWVSLQRTRPLLLATATRSGAETNAK
jgi:predicted transglutaminase-like cysteine proteinase